MAVSIGDGRVLLAGGVLGESPASTRVVDVRCMASCEATPLAVDALGFAYGWAGLTRTSEVLFVGDDRTGSETIVRRMGGLDATPYLAEVALREPRVGAAAVALFDRTVAVVGGRKTQGSGVPSVEVYIPE